MVIVRVFGQTLLSCIKEPEMECELKGNSTVREFLESDTERFGGLLEFLNKAELMVTINQRMDIDNIIMIKICFYLIFLNLI